MGAKIDRYQHKIQDGYQFYYNIMRKTIVQFLDLFNDIKIGRYDTETGRLLSFIEVPVKFSPKSKNWYWEEKLDENGNRIRDKIMPIIGIELIDVEIDTNRKVNRFYSAITGFHDRTDDRYIKERFSNPIPYNYSFRVTILAEYMVDIIQILEQILPYFDPMLFINITIPELSIGTETTEKLNLKVLYSGSNKEDNMPIPNEEMRHIEWSIEFTVEGWVFKPKYDHPVIKKVYQEFIFGDQPSPSGICEPSPTPSGGAVSLLTTGISAEKYPLDVEGDLDKYLYDPDIKLLYDYEKKE